MGRAKRNEKGKFIFAVGRRRESVARVRLYSSASELNGTTLKKGDFLVNSLPAESYFGNGMDILYKKPLTITKTEDKFAISALVRGGGKKGQMDALVLGISRALDEANPEFHTLLKKEGLLTRDQRIRERRKVGMGGKARRKKQSPKR